MIYIAIAVTITGCLILLKGTWKKKEEPNLELLLEQLPTKLMAVLTATISSQKGKLAELVAYMQLRSSYDRLIALGNIVDFIGIRFAKDDQPGVVDFIDVKNGKAARLSTDQKQLQDIIRNNQINFIKLRIDTDVNNETIITTDSNL